jgi:predicted membrane chloride channel (bestrophin family)
MHPACENFTTIEMQHAGCMRARFLPKELFMSPKIFRLIGLICCVAAAVIFVLNYTNTYPIGSTFTPFLLLGVGVLLLVRSRLTRS